MATLYDVAKLAGVSKTTVSRVFCNSQNVTDSTRERILECVKQLNYVPSTYAKQLNSKQTNLVGIIIPDISNPFYTQILKLLNQELCQVGLGLLLSFISDFETEKQIYTSMIASRPDCILFTPTSYDEIIGELLKGYDKYCLELYTNVFHPSFDSVINDDTEGTYIAAKHLLNCGHRNILLFDTKGRIPTGRIAGFAHAMEEYGVSYDEQVVPLPLAEMDTQSIHELISKKLQTYRPTAAIVTSEYSAGQLWTAASELGLRVPEDMSIIVYDDSLLCQTLGLTVVAHDLERIAHTIFERIMLHIHKENPETTETIKISPFLIKRKSVRENKI